MHLGGVGVDCQVDVVPLVLLADGDSGPLDLVRRAARAGEYKVNNGLDGRQFRAASRSSSATTHSSCAQHEVADANTQHQDSHHAADQQIG
jgi:hypothetical protein